jgi:hypothetical protein
MLEGAARLVPSQRGALGTFSPQREFLVRSKQQGSDRHLLFTHHVSQYEGWGTPAEFKGIVGYDGLFKRLLGARCCHGRLPIRIVLWLHAAPHTILVYLRVYRTCQ